MPLYVGGGVPRKKWVIIFAVMGDPKQITVIFAQFCPVYVGEVKFSFNLNRFIIAVLMLICLIDWVYLCETRLEALFLKTFHCFVT